MEILEGNLDDKLPQWTPSHYRVLVDLCLRSEYPPNFDVISLFVTIMQLEYSPDGLGGKDTASGERKKGKPKKKQLQEVLI